MGWSEYWDEPTLEYTENELKRHDEQIREEERERILDEFDKFMLGKRQFIDGYGHLVYAFDLNKEITRLREGK